MYIKFCFMFAYFLNLSSVIEGSWPPNCDEPLKDCSDQIIKFYLYVKENDEPYRLSFQSQDNLKSATLKSDAPIKLIIPGYEGGSDSWLLATFREEYLATTESQVIMVDYTRLEDKHCYRQTILPSVPRIGSCIADLLNILLYVRPDIKLEQFHVIGFGIGAHIAANLADNLQVGQLERITGLDPQNVGYLSSVVPVLDKRNAKLVDIYHTNAGWNGIYKPAGHIDVYFHRGMRQPGCDNDICSHKASIMYYMKSINSDPEFPAGKCRFLQIMMFLCTDHDSFTVGEHLKYETKNEGSYVFYPVTPAITIFPV